LLPRLTVRPPEGAGPFSLTVPVEPVPPTTLEGLSAIPTSAIGFTVRVALALTAPRVAVILAFLVVLTGSVETANVAFELPAGMVNDFGTVAALLFEASFTAKPPDGATPLRVRVPVDVAPPPTLFGLSVRPLRVGAFIVSVALTDEPVI